MFIHYRTKGIIFKKEDRGEADQLFTFYTEDFGRLEILGRAIRKISSKLRSGAELFYLSEIEFIQGKTHKTLTDAISIEKFKNLRKDLKRLSIAYKISEVLDNLVKGQEPDEKIWQLLNEVFQKLNSLSLVISHLSLLYYYFLWNLLSILGYRPELYSCSLCQKKLRPENLYFSPAEGGIICQKCFLKAKSPQAISPETIKLLRLILKKDWPTLSKLKFELKYIKSLELVSKNYFSFVLEKYS
jgi:DNA repair protein RecO (recombination protein O)